MASGPHTFTTSVVFSPERFQGQPLALISVRGPALPPSSPSQSTTTPSLLPNSLSQQRKSQIAKEFRLETGFLWDAYPKPMVIDGKVDGKEEGRQVWVRRLEVFDRWGREKDIGLTCIMGAAHYIFAWVDQASNLSDPKDRDAQRQSAAFHLPKANLTIPVFHNPYRQVVAVSIPLPLLQSFRTHEERVGLDALFSVQPQLKIVPTSDAVKKAGGGKGWPVVSLTKGVTFVLVDLTDSMTTFRSLDPGAKAPEVKLDGGQDGQEVGCMYYIRKGRSEQAGEPTIQNLQCRMISGGEEESGSGEACCALACRLALGEQEGELVRKTEEVKLENEVKADNGETRKETVDRMVFGIQQGVELGRLSTIAVEVDVRVGLDGKRTIASVILSGRGMFMLKGELIQV